MAEAEIQVRPARTCRLSCELDPVPSATTVASVTTVGLPFRFGAVRISQDVDLTSLHLDHRSKG